MRQSLLLFLFGCANLLQAQTPEQLFTQGNQFYQQGNIAQAREAYESVVASGEVSGELFYNLGNAYYRSGNVPKAILNYERAMRLMPADDDVRHNLQLATLMITDRIEPAPRLFVWEYWDAVKDWFSLRTLTFIGYALFVVVIGAIAALVLARTYALRRIAALVAMGVAVVFVFCLAVFAGKLGDVTRDDLAIVTAPLVTVKNSPDGKSTDAFVLHGGVKVQMIDRLNTWTKIRLADGKVGWMEGSAAETI